MRPKLPAYIGPLIGLIVFVFGLAWAGISDRSRQYTNQLNVTCGQYHTTDCDRLIWQVNAAGYDVIYEWDQYLAEPKKK